MKRIIIGLIILLSLVVMGCPAPEDISNQVFISTIGLDEVKKKEPVTGADKKTADIPPQYRVSVEMINPARIKNLNNKDIGVVRTVEAESIESALDYLQASVPRRLSLAHLRVLVVGEKFSRHNFKDTSSYFEKSPHVARRLRVMFVQGAEAIDIMNTKPEFQRCISEELVRLARMGDAYSTGRSNPFATLLKNLMDTNGRAMASRVALSEDRKTVVRSGAAVFNKWRVVDWLNPQETRFANWIVNGVQAPIVGNTGTGLYTYSVNKQTSHLEAVVREDRLQKFIVKIKTKGEIMQEQGKYIELDNPREVDKLEKVFAGSIAREIKSAVYKSQKVIGIDYLGFGRELEDDHPGVFKNLDWVKVYPNVPIEVQVKSQVNMVSLTE